MNELKLEKLLGECRKHIKRLRSASEKMSLLKMDLLIEIFNNVESQYLKAKSKI